MKDLEYECLKLGIPSRRATTRWLPISSSWLRFTREANLANDHNQLLMTIMDKIARRHQFRVLLHEKPFEGVNGSGKHNNWSLGTDTGVNLLGPGKTASENLQFITFLVNAISAVYKHNGLLKASIMSATNAHRLGANEAPPAIISTFLGTQVSAVLDKLAASKGRRCHPFRRQERLQDERHLAHPDAAARQHRPQPHFAVRLHGQPLRVPRRGFVGQLRRGDDRAQLGDGIRTTEFKKAVDAKIEAGAKKERAIYEVLKQMIKACKAIRFDGNGYSDEWKAEAKKRGLDCETSTPLIFDRYLDRESLKMFGDMGVFTKVELEARTEVKWETYTKKIRLKAACWATWR